MGSSLPVCYWSILITVRAHFAEDLIFRCWWNQSQVLASSHPKELLESILINLCLSDHQFSFNILTSKSFSQPADMLLSESILYFAAIAIIQATHLLKALYYLPLAPQIKLKHLNKNKRLALVGHLYRTVCLSRPPALSILDPRHICSLQTHQLFFFHWTPAWKIACCLFLHHIPEKMEHFQRILSLTYWNVCFSTWACIDPYITGDWTFVSPPTRLE